MSDYNFTVSGGQPLRLLTGGKYVDKDIVVSAAGETAKLGAKTITANGTYSSVADGLDGYNSVTVNVPAQQVSLQEKTVTPSTSAQEVTAESGYTGLSKVTVEAMPTATQATPTISVDSSGKITASATQSAGYVVAGTKSAEKQLTTRAAQTITPGTSAQEIPSGVYLTGKQTIAAVQTQTLTATKNGSYSPDAGKFFSGVTVNVPSSGGGSGGLPATITAGDTPVLASSVLVKTAESRSMTDTGIKITIPIAGTYRFKAGFVRDSTGSSFVGQLYKNNSAISGATVSWSDYEGTLNKDISCAAGDVISIRMQSGSTLSSICASQLVACIDWDNGF